MWLTLNKWSIRLFLQSKGIIIARPSWLLRSQLLAEPQWLVMWRHQSHILCFPKKPFNSSCAVRVSCRDAMRMSRFLESKLNLHKITYLLRRQRHRHIRRICSSYCILSYCACSEHSKTVFQSKKDPILRKLSISKVLTMFTHQNQNFVLTWHF